MADQLPPRPQYTKTDPGQVPQVLQGTEALSPLQKQFSNFLAGPATKFAQHLTAEQAEKWREEGRQAVREDKLNWVKNIKGKLGKKWKKRWYASPYIWDGGYEMSAEQAAIDAVQDANMEWANLPIESEDRRDPDGYEMILRRNEARYRATLHDSSTAYDAFNEAIERYGRDKIQANGQGAIEDQLSFTIGKGVNAVGSLFQSIDLTPQAGLTQAEVQEAALKILTDSIHSITDKLYIDGIPMSAWGDDGRKAGVHLGVTAMYIEALSKWVVTPEQYKIITDSFYELETGTGKLSEIPEVANAWAGSEAARLRNFGNIMTGVRSGQLTSVVTGLQQKVSLGNMTADRFSKEIDAAVAQSGESRDVVLKRYHSVFRERAMDAVRQIFGTGADPRINPSTRHKLKADFADMIVNNFTVTQESDPYTKKIIGNGLSMLNNFYSQGKHDDFLDFRLDNMTDDQVMASLWLQAGGRAAAAVDEDTLFMDSTTRRFFDDVAAELKLIDGTVGSPDIDQAMRNKLNMPGYDVDVYQKWSLALGADASEKTINYGEQLEKFAKDKNWFILKGPQHLDKDDIANDIWQEWIYKIEMYDKLAITNGKDSDKDSRIEAIQAAMAGRIYATHAFIIENMDAMAGHAPGFIDILPQKGESGEVAKDKQKKLDRVITQLFKDIDPYTSGIRQPGTLTSALLPTYDRLIHDKFGEKTDAELAELTEKAKRTGKTVQRLIAEEIHGEKFDDDLAMPLEYYYRGEAMDTPGFSQDNVQLYFDHNGNMTFHYRKPGSPNSPLFTISADAFGEWYTELDKQYDKQTVQSKEQEQVTTAAQRTAGTKIQTQNAAILASVDFSVDVNNPVPPSVENVVFRDAVNFSGFKVDLPWPNENATSYLQENATKENNLLEDYYWAERRVAGETFRYTRPRSGKIIETVAGELSDDVRNLLRSMGHDGTLLQKGEGWRWRLLPRGEETIRNKMHGNGRYRFWRGTDLDGNPTLAFDFEEYGSSGSSKKLAEPPNGNTDAWKELTDDEINTLFKRVGVDATKYHITEGFDESARDQKPWYYPYGDSGDAYAPRGLSALGSEGGSNEVDVDQIESNIAINDLRRLPPRGGDDEAAQLIEEDRVWDTQEERQTYNRFVRAADGYISAALHLDTNPVTEEPWSWAISGNEVLNDMEMAEYTYWEGFFNSMKDNIIDVLEDTSFPNFPDEVVIKEAHRRAEATPDPVAEEPTPVAESDLDRFGLGEILKDGMDELNMSPEEQEILTKRIEDAMSVTVEKGRAEGRVMDDDWKKYIYKKLIEGLLPSPETEAPAPDVIGAATHEEFMEALASEDEKAKVALSDIKDKTMTNKRQHNLNQKDMKWILRMAERDGVTWDALSTEHKIGYINAQMSGKEISIATKTEHFISVADLEEHLRRLGPQTKLGRVYADRLKRIKKALAAINK